MIQEKSDTGEERYRRSVISGKSDTGEEMGQ